MLITTGAQSICLCPRALWRPQDIVISKNFLGLLRAKVLGWAGALTENACSILIQVIFDDMKCNFGGGVGVKTSLH